MIAGSAAQLYLTLDPAGSTEACGMIRLIAGRAGFALTYKLAFGLEQ
jgi:hypothetical protein